MSSAAHEPTASAEKPILEPISTSTEHTDFLSAEASENLSKTQHAKSIGTTTPEVEGEEQQLVAAVEDYPTTPVSALDPKSDSPLRLTETPEPETEKVPLPPSSSLELSSSLNTKEAEEKALPAPAPLEKNQLEEAHEPQPEAAGVSAEIKDEQLPKGEEENEGKPIVSENGKSLETTAMTADFPQVEETSKLIETEDKLHPDDTEPKQIEENVLGQEDAHLQKEEELSPEAIQTAEPENHIPDAVSSLEPVSAVSIPATADGDKSLIEEEPGLEADDSSPKPVTQDTKGIDFDDKSEEKPRDSTTENPESKEVEVQEEKTTPAEVISAPETTDEVPAPSESEPEAAKETLPESLNENAEEPQTLLSKIEVPKTSETVEVAKEEPAAEATPESTSAEAPEPVAETEVEEDKDVESNGISDEVPVVEETPFAEIDVVRGASESIPIAKTEGAENFEPEAVALEEAKSDGDKPTTEDKVVAEENPIDEDSPGAETGNVAPIEDKPTIEAISPAKEVLEAGETSESKAEEVKAGVSVPTALDEPVASEEFQAVKETIAIAETPISDEAPEVHETPVSETEVIVVEVEAVEGVPVKEEVVIAEMLAIEDPLVQEKSTVDQESIPDDGLAVEPVPIEETKAVEDEVKGVEPEEVTNSSSEFKEAVVAEPVFGLSGETQEFKPEEPQTENTTTAMDQCPDAVTPIPVVEDSTLIEAETKKDQHSEELKGPENVEAVEILKGEAPFKDLGTMAEPSTGETASEELLVGLTLEPTAVIEEFSTTGDVGIIKAKSPPEDLAIIAEAPEDGMKSEEIAQPATEGQPAEEESITPDEEPANKEITIPEEDPVKGTATAEEDLAGQELTTTEDASTAEEMVSLTVPKTQQETQEEATEVIVPVEESEVGKPVGPGNGTEIEPEETQTAVPVVGIEEQAKEHEFLDKEAPAVETTAIEGSEKETSEVLMEVPEVVVELIAENQPSHGDDLGPDATLGQQDTFEKHKADAEPDKIVVEEPFTPEIAPGEEAAEPTPAEFEREVLSESLEEEVKLPEESAEAEQKQEELTVGNHEIKVEQTPATQILAVEETPAIEETAVGEVFSAGEDDTVVISHDDAKLEDVAEAEAAVKISNPADGEESENVIVATEPVPETPEQKVEITESLPQPEDLKEEQAETHEELKATLVDVATAERDPENLSQEVSINPFPASETTGNPINLAPGEKVPEFGASSIDANAKLDPESYEKADASNFGVKHDTEPEEVFLQPGEPVLDLGASSIESAVMLDEDSYEKADASNYGVKSEAATAVEPEEFSVKPLPASETAGNPIELQPGEPIPQIGFASIESNVKLDEESYEHADASNFGIKSKAATEIQSEEFPINPLPASEPATNPVELQPGELFPQIESSTIESNIKLDQESYEKADASSFGAKPGVESEEFFVNPLPASETATNPIDLQPVEPIPGIELAAVESNIRLDEESYEQADASNLGVKLPTSLEPTPEEVQEIYINPFPASQAPGNPIGFQPGEPIPKDQLGIESLEVNVKPDEEPYDRADASNFGVQSPVAKEDNVKEITQDDRGPVAAPEVEAPSVKTEATETGAKDIGLEGSPAPTETKKVETGLFVDKSAGEIIAPAEPESNTRIIAASVLGGAALGGAAIIALTSKDNASSSETVDSTTPAEATEIGKEEAVAKHADEEFIAELAPHTALSPVHGMIIPETDAKQVLEGVGISGAPAIVVSSPPTSPTVGKQQDEENRTVEVIEPTPEVTILGSTPKAVERESEVTPEGVRRRLAESTSLSRPVSSGNDTVSTIHHKNVMRTFWNILLFGWLGRLGRLFVFGKSKKSQRATQ